MREGGGHIHILVFFTINRYALETCIYDYVPPITKSGCVGCYRHIIAHSMRHEINILISGLPSGWQRAETLVGVPYYIK
jgi:hypothetical protein